VASWGATKLILVMLLAKGWKMQQINFVQAYTKADPKYAHMYMKLPNGFKVNRGNIKDYVLHLQKNLYSQKQAGRVWNKHLLIRMTSIGFVQSQVDECVLTRGNMVFIM
jgi:Reverse transcriptase (RNA-dependent DNA polymerase)